MLYLKFLCPNKVVLKIIKKEKVFFKVKIHVLHENGEFSFLKNSEFEILINFKIKVKLKQRNKNLVKIFKKFIFSKSYSSKQENNMNSIWIKLKR